MNRASTVSIAVFLLAACNQEPRAQPKELNPASAPIEAYSGTMYDSPVLDGQPDHNYVLLVHWKDHGPDYIQKIAGPGDCLEAAKSINEGLASKSGNEASDAVVLCFPAFES
jgi:hypothetical protein